MRVPRCLLRLLFGSNLANLAKSTLCVAKMAGGALALSALARSSVLPVGQLLFPGDCASLQTLSLLCGRGRPNGGEGAGRR
ncbi:hypothetical protein B5F40_13390 [Gordonibacter sp. An230]|nr:hypothetical protein B5F40_13390 [Gordonibacter sp. An230]